MIISLPSCGNFYPRSPCGERRPLKAGQTYYCEFLSTLSLRRATVTVLGIQHRVGISIHALLAESDNNAIRKRQIVPIISIHALLAESDAPWLARLASCSHFYPRSPCGERLVYTLIFANPMLFLSTLSLRRATPVRDVIQWEGIFLSTLSLRRATASDSLSDTSDVISIHALLAESDASKRAQQPKQPNFYPRSPCGERRLIRSLSIMLFDFYPRSPCGERPADLRRSSLQNRISIHALLAESDECRSMSADGFARISIHALLAESDFIFSSPVSISKKFLSTLSLRRATGRFGTTRIRRHFYPRSPCGERP